MAAVLACSTVGVILILLSPSSFTSSAAAAAASSFSASSSYDEAKRYANLPPTVFSPTGRLFGVERVAREAAKMTLSNDNKDASKKNDDDDGEMTYSSCFALTCRRHGRRKWRQQLQEPCSIDEGESLLIATTTTHNLKNDKQHNGEVDDTSNDDDDYDEFAVMVGIGPQSPYLHQDIHHRNNHVNYNNSSSDEKADKNESMITKTTTKSIINSPMPYDITRKYQPLLINDDDDDDDVNDDDDYDDNDILTTAATSSSAPIAILSSHLLIGSGGKAIDSTILLHRAIEMALSLYTSSDGGLLNFISHYNDNDNDDGRIQSGGVEGVHATTLSRQLADMAQSSTQTLGGRYGRMLSSSLLVLGTQQQQQLSQQKQQHRRTDDDNNDDNDKDINDDDAIILWRIDPTGQFYKVIASGIGRGGIYAELELMKYVRSWKRGALYKQKLQLLSQRQQETSATTTTMLTTTMEEQDEDVDEEDEGIVITTNDVQSYLGTLTPNDAIELAIDCLVNGIVASSSTIGGRSNGGSTINSREQQQQQQQQQRWHDDKDKYDVLSSYKEELRRRVHAVIIHSQIHEF